MTGAHPKVVQQVMRHQAITLTMDTYGHLFPGQEAEAIVQMRTLLGTPPEIAERMQATGTDDAVAGDTDKAQRMAQQSGREISPKLASQCDASDNTEGDANSPNPLQNTGVSDVVRGEATESQNTPGRTRTCNLRIRSPLLYPVELRALGVGLCCFNIGLSAAVHGGHGNVVQAKIDTEMGAMVNGVTEDEATNHCRAGHGHHRFTALKK